MNPGKCVRETSSHQPQVFLYIHMTWRVQEPFIPQRENVGLFPLQGQSNFTQHVSQA